MTITERRERERQHLRDKILDAARELFANEGYEATSMRKIAEKIEYSATAIYNHFEDKEALLRALCRNDFETLAARARLLRDISDPLERIERLGHGYIQFAIEHPNHFRFMFLTPHPPVPPTDEDVARSHDPNQDAYAFLVASVEEAIKKQLLRPELNELHLVAQSLWSIVHGVAALCVNQCKNDWVPQRDAALLAKTTIDNYMRGIRR